MKLWLYAICRQIKTSYQEDGFKWITMAGRILQFGFKDLKLNKIYAEYFDFNSCSGKVMEKNGMQLEGRLREHKIKNGRFVDTVIRGTLASEWKNHFKASF